MIVNHTSFPNYMINRWFIFSCKLLLRKFIQLNCIIHSISTNSLIILIILNVKNSKDASLFQSKKIDFFYYHRLNGRTVPRWRITRNVWYVFFLIKEPEEILILENSFIMTDMLVIRACFLFLYLPRIDLIFTYLYYVTL